MGKSLPCHFPHFAGSWCGRCDSHLLTPGSHDAVTSHDEGRSGSRQNSGCQRRPHVGAYRVNQAGPGHPESKVILSPRSSRRCQEAEEEAEQCHVRRPHPVAVRTGKGGEPGSEGTWTGVQSCRHLDVSPGDFKPTGLQDAHLLAQGFTKCVPAAGEN